MNKTELTGYETGEEIAVLEANAEPEDLDRFKRLRPLLGRYAQNAKDSTESGDFMYWWGKFIRYSGTIRRPSVSGNPSDDRVLLCGFGIGGEGGEVMEVVKKVYFHDHANIDTMSNERRDKLILELGDLFWYQFGLMQELGIHFDDVLEANMDKLTHDPRKG